MTAATLICDARADLCHCGLPPGHDLTMLFGSLLGDRWAW